MFEGCVFRLILFFPHFVTSRIVTVIILFVVAVVIISEVVQWRLTYQETSVYVKCY
jgi:hypothetical protein